jgi:hypothetical protein
MVPSPLLPPASPGPQPHPLLRPHGRRLLFMRHRDGGPPEWRRPLSSLHRPGSAGVDLLADDELKIQARRPLPPPSLRGATSNSEVKLPGGARFGPRRRHRLLPCSLARWSRRGWPTKKGRGGPPPLPPTNPPPSRRCHALPSTPHAAAKHLRMCILSAAEEQGAGPPPTSWWPATPTAFSLLAGGNCPRGCAKVVRLLLERLAFARGISPLPCCIWQDFADAERVTAGVTVKCKYSNS